MITNETHKTLQGYFEITKDACVMSSLNSKTRILYVEDNLIQRQLIVLILQRQGFEVKTANDGYEGVQLAQSWRPDLILMDLMMPTMNGFQATLALRADPKTEHIPIVAYSANPEKDIQVSVQAAGMDGFILKTATPDELINTLKTYLPVTR